MNYSLTIDIIDTKGELELDALIEDWIKQSDAFILAFSIINEKSYELIDGIYNRILQVKCGDISKNKKVPIILVGCRCDLENERVIDAVDAQEKAKSWGTEYLETSAKVRNEYNL